MGRHFSRGMAALGVVDRTRYSIKKEARVKAHVMVAFLGYALHVTLKHQLRRQPATAAKPSTNGVDNAQPLSAPKALALLSTLHSAHRAAYNRWSGDSTPPHYRA